MNDILPEIGGSRNLTADQQQKILAIRQEFERNTLALSQEIRKKRRELQQLWSADTLNQETIDAKSRSHTRTVKTTEIPETKTGSRPIWSRNVGRRERQRDLNLDNLNY